MIDAAIAAIADGHRGHGHGARLQGVVGDQGGDALGDVVIQLEADGRKATGRGVSTDVVEASARAYLNAVNKIVRAAASVARARRRTATSRAVTAADVNRWVEADARQRYLRERREHPAPGRGRTARWWSSLPRDAAARARPRDRRRLAHRSCPPRLAGVEAIACDFSTRCSAAPGSASPTSADGRRSSSTTSTSRCPRRGATFDVVVSAFAIHHVVDERKRALYGEVFERLVPGGVFFNLEHVASPTPELHDDVPRAIGKTPRDDDPSNKLVAGRDAARRGSASIGFDHVDCHWKWRELALLAGSSPRREVHEGLSRGVG